MKRTAKIIALASQYIGQMEITPNRGFKDPAFERVMMGTGWLSGQSWCAYFAKAVWAQAYADDAHLEHLVKSCCCGGAVNTYDNFKQQHIFKLSNTPVPGAIVIWKHGNGPLGHAGIVIAVNGNNITTIEGNTNTDGSREGDRVAKKQRALNLPFSQQGLNIVGFITPYEDA